MNKVLMISYSYPPFNSMGALRTAKFAKYLPHFGWRPIVITRKHKQSVGCLEEPQGVKVIRTEFADRLRFFRQTYFSGTVSNYRNLQYNLWHNRLLHSGSLLVKGVLSYPDSQIGWKPHAIRAARDVIRSDDISIMFSSSPPSTNHIIASELQHETGLPWVADFRDLWTQNHYYPHTLVRRRLESRLEKKVLRRAAALVSVSQPLAHKLGMLHKKQVDVVTNGFDEDDYKGKIPQSFKMFTLTYTGRFGEIYAGKRDPTLLFEAVKALLSSNLIESEYFQIRFYGPESDRIELENLASHYGIQRLVNHGGFVSYNDAILRQRTSTALLLLSWNNPEEKAIYPGKIFEYLGARRPILAIPKNNGVVDELLAKTNAGCTVGSKEEIIEILKSWYNEFRCTGHLSYDGNDEEISKYTRKTQTDKIAAIFRKTARN